MLDMLRDLVGHKGHANAALLSAVRQNAAAAADPELSELLHHILLANRFWLLCVQGRRFVLKHEARPASSLDALIKRYARTQVREEGWLAGASDADLAHMLTSPLIPHGSCTVAQAIMQVCLHSHGHRAQAAKLLRRHGGTPPPSDFILWVPARRPADWAGALASAPPAGVSF